MQEKKYHPSLKIWKTSKKYLEEESLDAIQGVLKNK